MGAEQLHEKEIVSDVARTLKSSFFTLKNVVPGSRVAVITDDKLLFNGLASTNNICVPIQPGISNTIRIRYAKKDKHYLPLTFNVHKKGTYIIYQVLDI